MMASVVIALAVALVGGLLPLVPRLTASTVGSGFGGFGTEFHLSGAGAQGLCLEGETHRDYRTNGNNDSAENELAFLEPPYQDLTPTEDTHEWVLSLCLGDDGTWSTAPGGSPVQQVRDASAAAEGALLDAALASDFGEPRVRTTPEIAGDTSDGRPFYVGLETWIEVHEDSWNAQASQPSSSEGVSVSVSTRPLEVLWTFGAQSGRCDNRGALAPEGLGAADAPVAPCGFAPVEWADQSVFTVAVTYEVTATGSLTGETRTETVTSDTFTTTRRVDEVQAFGVDPSGGAGAPPPADRDYDDGRDCSLNPLSWGQCARDAVEWAVDIVAGGIELLWDLARGCGDAIADKFGEVIGIVGTAVDFITDPVGWIEDKVQVLRDTLDQVTADLGGAALELVKGALEWDLLVSDPVRWVGKVGCGLLIEVFSGSIATKFSRWLDDLIVSHRDRRNNDSDPNNDVDDDTDVDTTHPSCRTNNSFPTGTPVLMADGSLRAIDRVEPGDQVRAFNTETRVWSDRLVLDQWSYLDTDEMATLTLADGSQVSATDHHRFWLESERRWAEAEVLEPGDLLLTPDGVTSLSDLALWDTDGTLVWELTVDIDHTFAVHTGTENLLVHNCTPEGWNDADAAAIADYTGEGFDDINSALRSGDVDPDLANRIDAVEDALDKLPVYEGTVYRGTDLPPDVAAGLQPGAEFSDAAFMSTSTDPSEAFSGDFQFTIESRTGSSIGDLSDYPNEAEVLFGPGTNFVIDTVEVRDGVTYVTMTESP